MESNLVAGHIANLKESLENYHILVATPKKFIDQFESSESKQFFDHFQHIVLDEADKYFELQYQTQLEKIFEIFKSNKKTYYLFSATFPYQIEKVIDQIFIDKIEIIVGGKVKVLNSIT